VYARTYAQILGVVLILVGLVGLALGNQVWGGILNVDIAEDIAQDQRDKASSERRTASEARDWHLRALLPGRWAQGGGHGGQGHSQERFRRLGLLLIKPALPLLSLFTEVPRETV
jgi:hypothetical protein